MRIIGFIGQPDVIKKILQHLGEPSEAMEPLERLEQVERTDPRDERSVAVERLERGRSINNVLNGA